MKYIIFGIFLKSKNKLRFVNLFQSFIILIVLLITSCPYWEPPYTFYFVNESLVNIEINSDDLNPSNIIISPGNTRSAVANLREIDYKYSPASLIVISDFNLSIEHGIQGIYIYFKDK